MINMKALEELRTKEELINYFKHLGKNITEEELDALKQSYNKVQESNEALTLEQLDDVAGGFVEILLRKENFVNCSSQNFMRYINESGKFPNYNVVAVEDKNYVALFVNNRDDRVCCVDLANSKIQFYRKSQSYALELIDNIGNSIASINLTNTHASLGINLNDFWEKSMLSPNVFPLNHMGFGWGRRYFISNNINEKDWLDKKNIFYRLRNNDRKDIWQMQKNFLESYMHMLENSDIEKIPGLERFEDHIYSHEPHIHDDTPYYLEYIDYCNMSNNPNKYTKAQIDKDIIKLQKVTGWNREETFENISGLKEFYDKATGLSLEEKVAISMGIGVAVGMSIEIAIEFLLSGLGKYFTNQNNDKIKNLNQ